MRRLLLAVLGLSGLTAWSTEPAQAYIGLSFLQVPGVKGDWRGAEHKGWVRLESNYWNEKPPRRNPLGPGTRLVYSEPLAPASGSGRLTLAIDKHSPAYAGMMALCRRGAPVPEITYAESSERSRPKYEVGDRPASVPEYFEYTLKDVSLSCPEVANAPEQALILRFGDIAWRNYTATGKPVPAIATPAHMPPAQRSGKTRAYVLNWLVSANSVSPDQCPVMSKGPTEADYYALMAPEQAAARRAELAPKGGVLASNGLIYARGPEGINVMFLPGVVADPGNPAPQTATARGFDLDGDRGRRGNGTGAQHKNYVSEDGQRGIDNQLYTIDACIKGFGRLGILTVTTIEMRRNGDISMVVLVSGIDDDKNDDHVDVTLFYSRDPMVKSATGKDILPGYTFRVSEDPQRTPFIQRLHGRIVDGVLQTDTVPEIDFDKGRDTTRLFRGRMRLEMKPDRTLKGIMGGYLDWHDFADSWSTTLGAESGFGFSVPGGYDALKRAADGLPDPVTGEPTGISAAFDVEGVSIFIPPEQEQALLSSPTGLALAK